MAGIPVIIVRGVLESGKTFFIKDSLARGDFGDLGKVLILSQEDGVEVFENEMLNPFDIYSKYFTESEWTDKNINEAVREYKPQVIFIELNEMWDREVLSYPTYFDVQQVIAVIDGSSFDLYFNSMRQIFVDMLKESEVCIINRADNLEKAKNVKKNLKVINSALEIIALSSSGNVIKIPTELPYDITKDEIQIKMSEFGDFYVDSVDGEETYQNKIVEFSGMTIYSEELPPHTFFIARPALTCCQDDIQTIGLLCSYVDGEDIPNETWIKLKARVHYIKIEGEKQLVLEYLSHTFIKTPTQDEMLVKLN